jgi:hypothetical protein
MAQPCLVSVELDPHGAPAAGPCAVELVLLWGGDVIAVEIARAPRGPDDFLRAEDLRAAAMQGAFEGVPLARAEGGAWRLLLPDGAPAPEGSRITARAGKALLRARKVPRPEIALPRARSDGRVRRAVLGAMVLHLAVVTLALELGRPSPPAAVRVVPPSPTLGPPRSVRGIEPEGGAFSARRTSP